MRKMFSAALAALSLIVAVPAAAAVPIVCNENAAAFDCNAAAILTPSSAGSDFFIAPTGTTSTGFLIDFNEMGVFISNHFSTAVNFSGTYTFTPLTPFTSISGVSSNLYGANFEINSAGQFILTLDGVAGPGSANISFAPRAVPESATWAMMLLGFGGIGMTMRRRKPLLQIA